MNVAHILIAAASAIPTLAQTPAALSRIRTSFDLVVPQPYPETVKLFGPEGERDWAGSHWNPEFLHPQPAADVEGAVFTIQHGPMKAVWVSSLRDLEARHLQYVYFLPNILVTVIDVRFQPAGPATTQVNVVYTRSALTPNGNEPVVTRSHADQTAGKEWQKAIDDYLASTAKHPAP